MSDSKDFLDSLSPFVPIIHRSWHGLQTISSVRTELMQNNSQLVNQYCSVHVLGSIEECRFWVSPCFFSSVPFVLFVLLGWFVRWEVSGHQGSIEECPLWVCPCFSSSVPYVLFVLLGWFVRWEVSGCTAVVLWEVASKIFCKQHAAFLCRFYQAFS